MILTQFFSLVTEMSVSKGELTGFLSPKKQDDIKELQEWAETSSEFELIDNNLEINKRIAFRLAPMLENGLGYASYEKYFDKKREWWEAPDLENVVAHQWYKYQSSNQQIKLDNLNKVATLLRLLTDKNRFYITNNIVVFFSKKPSELALNAKEPSQLIKLIRDLNQAQINAIDEICRWFGANTEDEHVYSKKHAFSEALSDFLIEKEGRIRHDICDLLENIVNIQEQAIAQHDLYLEDFSYGKFVKKIEENASKFTTRINDTLGKSVTQVLGIPIATAVFNLAKIELHWGSVVSLVVYTLLCALVLFTQQCNLSHIEEEFRVFENKLPKQLKNEVWKINRKTINSQLKSQKRLTQFLWLIILGAFWYASYLIGYLAAKTDWSFFSKLL
ncbi:TPA: hypothetical protein ACPORJ_001633 [Haemophilus influenzae]|uniref:hypothetical protein n=2 Tax=Haemophilus influenzae TaxID=727 RepID=UPI000CFF7434|nr:hypothetical protein [Haemophilus influenzae]MCK8884922.1 hypothetical protein [Haemophilus influenzae]PRI46538.1 hypothetical protein BVZ71_00669 [Haemophilus influenzae]PRM36820.1 hypothetical protein BVZ73_01209 [Haemophilus influenzae]